jgi:predicted small lipoprotein YifL
MKRAISIALAAASILSLAACGSAGDAGGAIFGPPQTDQAPGRNPGQALPNGQDPYGSSQAPPGSTVQAPGNANQPVPPAPPGSGGFVVVGKCRKNCQTNDVRGGRDGTGGALGLLPGAGGSPGQPPGPVGTGGFPTTGVGGAATTVRVDAGIGR